MNKEILVKTVAGNIEGATKKDIEVVVNEVFDVIKKWQCFSITSGCQLS